MNYVKRVCVLSGALLSLGCASVSKQLSDIVFIPNANSDKRTEELIEVELAFSVEAPDVESRKNGDQEFSAAFAGAGAIASTVAQIAISQIGKTLAEEAERYNASYSAEASSDNFYHYDAPTMQAQNVPGDSIRGKSDIRFAGFRLTRTIKKKGSSDAKTAMSICAIVLPSRTDHFFYIIPVSYGMRYSKAKLIAFNMLSPFGVDLLNPWEIITDPLTGEGFDLPPADSDLDLTMSVSFEYLHYQQKSVSGETQQELTATTVGPNTFDIKGVKVGKKPRYGYFPAFEKFKNAKTKTDFKLQCDESAVEPITVEYNGENKVTTRVAQIRDKIMKLHLDDFDRMRLASGSKSFPSAPRTLSAEKGNGNFMIKVEVSEFDDYGARVKEVSDTFNENKDDIQKKLTDFLNGGN